MEVKQIVALLVKVFALALALYSLNNTASIISFIQDSTFRDTAYFQIASSTCLLLVALFLWFFPFSVAAKILPAGSEESKHVGNITYEDMRAICFTTIALYLLFNVVSDAFYWGSFFVIYNTDPNNLLEISPFEKASIFTTVIELMILLPLLFGRKGFAKLFYKLRYGT